MLWQQLRAPLNTEQNGTARSATAAAGILTMLSGSVGLTTELFYTFERQEAGDFEVDTDTFGLAAGIAAFVF